MSRLPFAVEQDGDTRFEIDLALDISAFSILNGVILFWAVLSPALDPLRNYGPLVLNANLLLAIALILPCLRVSSLVKGPAAPKLVLLLAWACIAVSARHFADRLAQDMPALFLCAAALAALTYLVAALLALLSFKGEATIRIG